VGGRERRERGVTLQIRAVLVEEHRPVGVAVVGDTHVRAGRPHQPAEVREVRRDRFRVPAGKVAVRLGVDRDDPTAESAEERRGGERARAVAGVQRHGELGVRDALAVDRREQFVDVAPAGAVDPFDLADAGPVHAVGAGGVGGAADREQSLLDPFERGTRQLRAVGADEFHAVVRGRVVTRGDHHRGDGLGGAVGLQAGRRDGAESAHVTADRGQPGGRGVGQHRAGPSGVPSQRDDRLPVGPERRARGPCDASDELGCHLLADDPTDAAGPEYLHRATVGTESGKPFRR
jgi:hypothetical protein